MDSHPTNEEVYESVFYTGGGASKTRPSRQYWLHHDGDEDDDVYEVECPDVAQIISQGVVTALREKRKEKRKKRLAAMATSQRKQYRLQRREKKKDNRRRSGEKKEQRILNLAMDMWSDQQEAAAATIIHDLEPGEEDVAEAVGRVGGESVDSALLSFSNRTTRPIRARDGTYFAAGVGGLRGAAVEKQYEAGRVVDARGSMRQEVVDRLKRSERVTPNLAAVPPPDPGTKMLPIASERDDHAQCKKTSRVLAEVLMRHGALRRNEKISNERKSSRYFDFLASLRRGDKVDNEVEAAMMLMAQLPASALFRELESRSRSRIEIVSVAAPLGRNGEGKSIEVLVSGASRNILSHDEYADELEKERAVEKINGHGGWIRDTSGLRRHDQRGSVLDKSGPTRQLVVTW